MKNKLLIASTLSLFVIGFNSVEGMDYKDGISHFVRNDSNATVKNVPAQPNNDENMIKKTTEDNNEKKVKNKTKKEKKKDKKIEKTKENTKKYEKSKPDEKGLTYEMALAACKNFDKTDEYSSQIVNMTKSDRNTIIWALSSSFSAQDLLVSDLLKHLIVLSEFKEMYTLQELKKKNNGSLTKDDEERYNALSATRAAWISWGEVRESALEAVRSKFKGYLSVIKDNFTMLKEKAANDEQQRIEAKELEADVLTKWRDFARKANLTIADNWGLPEVDIAAKYPKKEEAKPEDKKEEEKIEKKEEEPKEDETKSEENKKIEEEKKDENNKKEESNALVKKSISDEYTAALNVCESFNKNMLQSFDDVMFCVPKNYRNKVENAVQRESSLVMNNADGTVKVLIYLSELVEFDILDELKDLQELKNLSQNGGKLDGFCKNKLSELEATYGQYTGTNPWGSVRYQRLRDYVDTNKQSNPSFVLNERNVVKKRFQGYIDNAKKDLDKLGELAGADEDAKRTVSDLRKTTFDTLLQLATRANLTIDADWKLEDIDLADKYGQKIEEKYAQETIEKKESTDAEIEEKKESKEVSNPGEMKPEEKKGEKKDEKTLEVNKKEDKKEEQNALAEESSDAYTMALAACESFNENMQLSFNEAKDGVPQSYRDKVAEAASKRTLSQIALDNEKDTVMMLICLSEVVEYNVLTDLNDLSWYWAAKDRLKGNDKKLLTELQSKYGEEYSGQSSNAPDRYQTLHPLYANVSMLSEPSFVLGERNRIKGIFQGYINETKQKFDNLDTLVEAMEGTEEKDELTIIKTLRKTTFDTLLQLAKRANLTIDETTWKLEDINLAEKYGQKIEEKDAQETIEKKEDGTKPEEKIEEEKKESKEEAKLKVNKKEDKKEESLLAKKPISSEYTTALNACKSFNENMQLSFQEVKNGVPQSYHNKMIAISNGGTLALDTAKDMALALVGLSGLVEFDILDELKMLFSLPNKTYKSQTDKENLTKLKSKYGDKYTGLNPCGSMRYQGLQDYAVTNMVSDSSFFLDEWNRVKDRFQEYIDNAKKELKTLDKLAGTDNDAKQTVDALMADTFDTLLQLATRANLTMDKATWKLEDINLADKYCKKIENKKQKSEEPTPMTQETPIGDETPGTDSVKPGDYGNDDDSSVSGSDDNVVIDKKSTSTDKPQEKRYTYDELRAACQSELDGITSFFPVVDNLNINQKSKEKFAYVNKTNLKKSDMSAVLMSLIVKSHLREMGVLRDMQRNKSISQEGNDRYNKLCKGYGELSQADLDKEALPYAQKRVKEYLFGIKSLLSKLKCNDKSETAAVKLGAELLAKWRDFARNVNLTIDDDWILYEVVIANKYRSTEKMEADVLDKVEKRIHDEATQNNEDVSVARINQIVHEIVKNLYDEECKLLKNTNELPNSEGGFGPLCTKYSSLKKKLLSRVAVSRAETSGFWKVQVPVVIGGAIGACFTRAWDNKHLLPSIVSGIYNFATTVAGPYIGNATYNTVNEAYNFATTVAWPSIGNATYNTVNEAYNFATTVAGPYIGNATYNAVNEAYNFAGGIWSSVASSWQQPAVGFFNATGNLTGEVSTIAKNASSEFVRLNTTTSWKDVTDLAINTVYKIANLYPMTTAALLGTGVVTAAVALPLLCCSFCGKNAENEDEVSSDDDKSEQNEEVENVEEDGQEDGSVEEEKEDEEEENVEEDEQEDGSVEVKGDGEKKDNVEVKVVKEVQKEKDAQGTNNASLNVSKDKTKVEKISTQNQEKSKDKQKSVDDEEDDEIDDDEIGDDEIGEDEIGEDEGEGEEYEGEDEGEGEEYEGEEEDEGEGEDEEEDEVIEVK